MVLSILRLDMRAPESASSPNDLYPAALDMAEFADQNRFGFVVLSEHHQTDDGYLPAPLVMAAAIAGRTARIRITIRALLAPLHDPVRLAEELAVVDLASKGRVSSTLGIGYRREEYEAAGLDWTRRGKLLDECIETLLAAWTGERFDFRGRNVRVLPRPYTQPHPPIMVGGSSEAAVRRAVRFHLPLVPAINDAGLAERYESLAAEEGFEDGFVILPGEAAMVYVHEDPEKGWEEWAPYMLHDAVTYEAWQTPDVRSQVTSHARTLDELKEEGRYLVLTPDECVERIRSEGPRNPVIHFPLVGGAPPELGWRSLKLYAEEVLPRL